MDEDLITFPDTMWAGTPASLDIARAFYARLAAEEAISAMKAGTVMDPNRTEKPVPYKFSLHGNVAVISIRGSLVNNDSPWLRYYEGVTGYPAIREALIYAVHHADVKGILLDIESGGGAVSGVEDTHNLVAQVGKVKPVWAFSGGSMCSAAYWFGCAAKKVFTARTTIMGSIGIINTHIEYSKALEKEGVGVTQTRSGKYKALASPYEPLSDAAKAKIKDQVDHLYGVFIDQVADARGVSKDLADEKMGQGREFIGDQSVSVGLADAVTTFDQVMSRFAATLDKSPNPTQNVTHSPIRNTNMRTALTEQQIAALTAAGMPPQPEATNTPPAAAVTPPAAAPAAAAAPDALTVLTDQLAAKDKTILDANVELTTLRAQVAAQTTLVTALAAVVGGSVETMAVALGQSKPDLTASTPDQVLAQFNALKPTFEKTFPVGGVAVPTAVDAAKGAAKGAAGDKGKRTGIAPLELAKATGF